MPKRKITLINPPKKRSTRKKRKTTKQKVNPMAKRKRAKKRRSTTRRRVRRVARRKANPIRRRMRSIATVANPRKRRYRRRRKNPVATYRRRRRNPARRYRVRRNPRKTYFQRMFATPLVMKVAAIGSGVVVGTIGSNFIRNNLPAQITTNLGRWTGLINVLLGLVTHTMVKNPNLKLFSLGIAGGGIADIISTFLPVGNMSLLGQRSHALGPSSYPLPTDMMGSGAALYGDNYMGADTSLIGSDTELMGHDYDPYFDQEPYAI